VMSRSTLHTLGVVLTITASLWLPSATAQQATASNRGFVEIETSSSAGISVRIAEDLSI
jgi:hypothetical protein